MNYFKNVELTAETKNSLPYFIEPNRLKQRYLIHYEKKILLTGS